MPTPEPKEKKKDFISRCLASEEMRSRYPKQEQQSAVCYSKWNQHVNNRGKK